ncbi:MULTISPECIES: NADH:ubiquinone oxidoreductase [unclassified Ensifer]|uniref:NADH:ubiquinone oxidoreductase n=1 Tax=unclassified Ensifer TaxID=2633371 RepID=UPI0008138917|nr:MULTISPECIES: NADH:ubiquinone oxidoreductase [unclassified Ensifer]OCP16412.1 NADH:ubiquinone oxidoreductase [Ensifer sp. LC54]OCP20397.1 NADH:ubiquinone oxidoreductase [Ensifer sp. LC384]
MAGADKDGQVRGEAESGISSARPFGGDPADPFGMAEWMKSMPQVPLHPLMAHPAGAVAAATALGFGLSSHIAGVMLGAMQGAVEALQKGSALVGQTQAGVPAKAASVQAEARLLETVKPVVAMKSTVSKPKAEKKPAEPVKAPAASKAKARAADDLKRISGIGPKLEQVLNGKGVRRFADIAAWSDADITRFDDELGFGGRILRDDWVKQAKALKGAKE